MPRHTRRRPTILVDMKDDPEDRTRKSRPREKKTKTGLYPDLTSELSISTSVIVIHTSLVIIRGKAML